MNTLASHAVYEGAEDAEACQRVRTWLLDQADAVEFRAACKEAGVSVGEARKAAKVANMEHG